MLTRMSGNIQLRLLNQSLQQFLGVTSFLDFPTLDTQDCFNLRIQLRGSDVPLNLCLFKVSLSINQPVIASF